MSSLVSVEGSPDEVSGTGSLIKALSADLGSQTTGIVSEINTLEAGQPWGNDHFGESFKNQPQGYFSVPEGGDKAFNEILKDELGNAGDNLGKIGDGVTHAMMDYQVTDTTNANTIKKLPTTAA
ncbi:MAG: hypothetical protein V7603_1258 [Micromonosporaceae bacterium]